MVARPTRTIAYCLLGSNKGPSLLNLRRAVFLLASAEGHVEVLRASHVYRTPPWGKTDQPEFLNAAVEIATDLAAEELLDCFQQIERRLGRLSLEERERWGPRVIDLDLAIYGRETIDSPRLKVPHPRLRERAFALLPLLEIAPDLCDLETGEPLARALREIDRETVEACRPGEKLAFGADDLGELSRKPEDARSLESLVEKNLLYRSESPEDTERLGCWIGDRLRGGEVIGLVGQLGTGKTCFARGVARGLDIREPITSPSYVLIKSYEGRLALHHADFYRLESAEGGEEASLDPVSLGLEDYVEDPEAVLLVEWANYFPRWLEPPFYVAEVAGSGSSSRLILIRRITQVPT